jgi:hypothetical protein
MTSPAPTESSVVLSTASPRGVLSVERGTERLLLAVTEVTNPGDNPVTIVVEDNGSPPAVQRFSLYPPDRPARFSIRLSHGATEVRVSLVSARSAANGNVSLQLKAVPPSDSR